MTSARRLVASLLGAIGLLAVAVGLALSLGSEPVSFARALEDPSSLDRALLLDARLPRVLLAAVAGGGLAAVGAALQGLLRNPLADPYVLGVSGGAALGATIAITLGVSATTWLGALALPAAAWLAGLGASALVYALARRAGSARGAASGADILLAGVIVNGLASAAITLMKALVSAAKAQELLFWLMGFLDVPAWSSLGAVAACVAAGVALLAGDAARLNALALGAEPAAHLGVDVVALERRVFVAASLVVGAIVCATGLIGFVGLVVPHALRLVVGADHRRLVPLSVVTGAAALVACDLASRLVFRALGTEPPVGAITALIGGPVFLALFVRRERS